MFTIRSSSSNIVTKLQSIIYARVQYRKISSPTPSTVGRMGELDIHDPQLKTFEGTISQEVARQANIFKDNKETRSNK